MINPVLAAGQIEGGVAQAIGWALYENVVWQDGRMVNAPDDQLHHADVVDVPPIRVYFEERPYAARARRAPRASASCRWTAPAPAIVNAVEHATGVDVRPAAAHARSA